MTAGLIATTLGACAPDAWRPDAQYNAFLDRVQNECPYFHIGNDSGRETFNDSLFLDQTSMLFHGKITEADWRTSMYSEFNTGPDDPGIAYLLSKLPPKRVPAYGAPVGIPPVESPPPAASLHRSVGHPVLAEQTGIHRCPALTNRPPAPLPAAPRP